MQKFYKSKDDNRDKTSMQELGLTTQRGKSLYTS